MSEIAREFTRRAFSNWIERRIRIMGEELPEVAQDVQDMHQQTAANMAIPNWNPHGQIAPYGYGLDPATQAAVKEYAHVQQSVMVLHQAAAIRADKKLMEAIEKYLRSEKAKINHMLVDLER